MPTFLHDTPESVSVVLSALKDTQTLLFDCEGPSLGMQGGGVVLLSLGTPQSDDVHLVHITPIGLPALCPIFELFESAAVQKVTYDGRLAQSGLFYECGGVMIHNVVDMQVVVMQAQRLADEGKSVQARAQRLIPYLPPREVLGKPELYPKLLKLPALGSTVKELKIGGAEGITNVELKRRLRPVVNWSDDILTQDHIDYAANDIHLLHKLYTHFTANMAPTATQTQASLSDGKAANAFAFDQNLRDASAAYVSMWTTAARQPCASHPYRGHPLFPLGILDEPGWGDDLVVCEGCKRELMPECFSKNNAAASTGHGNLSASAPGHGGKCLVCCAVQLHNEKPPPPARQMRR
uniref:3'-5' exonuclease n=1 Tax=Mycena chlorophos TaxID=658473 RepID=A0ABQ0LUD8_MYCCL|nr:3'-5' exonuclease [Mycena chlorophos]